ncbi:PQQ-binding-like beta-propeller repeat protein [Mariniflexile aquimaris]|uniref:PQQ-binding-like beta-propeller repeat protein n=1 Tax=Mariniflexile aquimaris TaxID=881009 RepID=A0ABW3BRS5_9FLAO
MKNRLLFGLLILIAITSMAQSSKVKVSYNDKAIGLDIKSQKNIIAKEYIFPNRIHEIYLDTISNYMTLKLRKLSKNGKILSTTGDILVFDLNNKQVKWDKKVDFSQGNIHQYGTIITQYVGNKLINLNNNTGEHNWDIKNDLYYVDPIKKIGIGYQYKGLAGNIHTLEAINLTNGNALWEKELNRTFGWNKIIKLNDSTLLIASSGLHSINLNNGSGWDYTTVTGKKDYTETIAKNITGVTLGILTGTYVTSSGPNVVRDVVSNIIIDSSTIYVASKESISNIYKHNGEIAWTNPLPEDATSKSSIFIKDSLLYMVNYGYAYWGNKKIDFGVPFIMGVNKNTGEQIFYNTISEKNEPISDFKTHHDTLVISFKNKLSTYSLRDGSEINSKIFDTDNLGELKYFIGNHIYIKDNNNSFSQLITLDSTNYFIQTSNRKALMLDLNLTITKQFDFDDLYYSYGTINKCLLLAKDDQTIILDETNQEMARLDLSYNSVIVGNTFYDFKDNSLFVVNLDDLFGAKPNP